MFLAETYRTVVKCVPTMEEQCKRFFVYVLRTDNHESYGGIEWSDERRTNHKPCSRLPRGIGSIVLPDKSDFRDGVITFLRE